MIPEDPISIKTRPLIKPSEFSGGFLFLGKQIIRSIKNLPAGTKVYTCG
jgi:hypothetical protein